jgi:chromosome segregation ATPase
MQAFTKHTEDRLTQIESHIKTQNTTTDTLQRSVQTIQEKAESDKAELRKEAEAARQTTAQENSSQMAILMAQLERMQTLITQALPPQAAPMGQQAAAEGATLSPSAREYLAAHPPDRPNV